jgi:hypothetical protein
MAHATSMAATVAAAGARSRGASSPSNPPFAAPRLRAASRRRDASRARSFIAPRGLGFDLGENDDKLRPDVEAAALIEDAASLLFLQDAMMGDAAQAYLALLAQISTKATPAKVFQAYGAFFRAVATADADSFLDVVLDEVITARRNPLAERCAALGASANPTPVELAAVRSDLELLQRLCVSETTIARWIETVASQGKFFFTLVPIRPRWRGERRSLRTLPGASLLPHLAFNPSPRRLSTPTDAFQLHPDGRVARSRGRRCEETTGRLDRRRGRARRARAPRGRERGRRGELRRGRGRGRDARDRLPDADEGRIRGRFRG